jgi:hypothetical protein
VTAFLLSDASYMTGQTIYADGGRMPLNYTVPVKDRVVQDQKGPAMPGLFVSATSL